MLTVRDASPDDGAAIRDLYNALIPTTTGAWTETLETLTHRQAWLRRQRQAGCPVLVAETNFKVIGFSAYSSFRGEGRWPGYRYTVEHSIHVSEAHWGGGVGRALMEALIGRARVADVHVMVGAIDSDNIASLRFHERLGFTPVALMPQVGRKFERWLDLVLVQRILDGPT